MRDVDVSLKAGQAWESIGGRFTVGRGGDDWGEGVRDGDGIGG